MTTFSRLKQLSTDLDEIKNALKKSESGLLEIHETEYKVRRSVDRPLPDHDDPMIRKSSKEKTLYMVKNSVVAFFSHLLIKRAEFS